MTATIGVLKSGPHGINGLVDYFVSDSLFKYYENEHETSSFWFGDCAKQLGLTGLVQAEHFRNLLAGKSPDGKKQLVRIARHKTKPSNPLTSSQSPMKQALNAINLFKSEAERAGHVPGIDICFSLVKSLTALWALLNMKQRRKLERLIATAIKQSLQWLISEVPLARTGKGGCNREFAEIAVAIFRHTTARNHNDPQLHYHCVIPNVVRQANGKYSKVDSRALHKWTRTVGPLFRNNLAKLLQEEMGLKLHQPLQENGTKAGWFEIVGVPKNLCDHWSSRSKEIAAMTQLAVGGKASAKAKQFANLATRQKKGKPLSPAELLSTWKTTGEKFGFGEKEAAALLNQPQKVINVDNEFNVAFTKALTNLTGQNAYFERRHLIQAVSEQLQAVPINGDQVVEKIDREIQKQEQILTLKIDQYQSYYTTPAMWELEKKLLTMVKELQETHGAQAAERHLQKALAEHPTIQPEQAEAARKLVTGKGSLRTLQGIAGSGKSYALDVVRAAFEKAGYKVIGGALSGIAKEELAAQANISSRTIASYIYHLDKSRLRKAYDRTKHDVRMIIRAARKKSTYLPNVPRLNKKTVLVIDEAGMVDTASMAKLLKYVKKAGATLILAGDTKQLSPIAAGGPFQRIIRESPPALLTKNIRLKNPEDAKAASLIRDGKAMDALKNLIERDRLCVSKTREACGARLLAEWTNDGNLQNPKNTIILTQTKSEAKQINRNCQSWRMLAGELSKRSFKLTDETIHEKDRIIFHKALRIRGIENGFQGTVVSINSWKKEVTILLDRKPSGKSNRQFSSQTIQLTFDQLKKGEVHLSYALTSHKAQGQTFQRAYVLLGGPMTSKELVYVQSTRAKEFTKFFVDRANAGKEYEQIQKDIATSRMKDLAHDIAKISR